jgi:crotonobetainyl-CoA:carnitine CoA-transferase CaiB-like acyl-CoA transferase
MPHPLAGEVPLVASPIRMSETPVEYRRPPPLLGQHTREVLVQRLGLDKKQLDALAAAGVI